jgi:hypothetical protein
MGGNIVRRCVASLFALVIVGLSVAASDHAAFGAAGQDMRLNSRPAGGCTPVDDCRKQCDDEAEECERQCRKLPKDDKSARQRCWIGCNEDHGRYRKKC